MFSNNLEGNVKSNMNSFTKLFETPSNYDGIPLDPLDARIHHRSAKTAIITEKLHVVKNMVEHLGPNDVLCGKDKEAFNSIGNRRFRVSVSLIIGRYIQAKSKQEKTLVIQSLVNVVKESGGRFLKRKNDGLVELNEKQTQQKVGHAIRDTAISRKLVDRRKKRRVTRKSDSTGVETRIKNEISHARSCSDSCLYDCSIEAHSLKKHLSQSDKIYELSDDDFSEEDGIAVQIDSEENKFVNVFDGPSTESQFS